MNARIVDDPNFPPGEIAPVPRMSSVIARLSLANVLIAAAGFVTGPLQARALGPAGRGELAAIIVPVTLAPQVLGLALGAYVIREAASGRRPVNELAGSVGLPLLLISVLGMFGAVPVADALAQGNHTVELYLTIGLLLLPVGLIGGLGVAMVGGLERWSLIIATRCIPVVVPFVGVAVLYVIDEMSVGRVAVLTMAGGVLSVIPSLTVIARSGRPVFRMQVAWESITFGLRSWVGGLAQLANARLDQLLMITLVTSRELGLYAVAVTLAGISGFLSGALSVPLITRVAKGDTAIVARALRVTLSAVIVMNAGLACLTPVLLPLLFGADFADAVKPALILLAAGIPLAGIAVLASALAADGAPGLSSAGEAIALGIAVPGLLILVPGFGGMGAALVSLVAYGASFTFQLVIVRRRLGGKMRAYLLPQREDIRWTRSLLPRFPISRG
jgi:O-antigen/teichoic acid export membrane protein